jgi:ABC-type sugar transport system substrate-binding protein
VQRWLGIVARSNRRVDLVGCQNDPMAAGAREALSAVAAELNRPDVARIPVTGCDGMPRLGERMLREGLLVATIRLPSPGGAAVDWLAARLLRAELPPVSVTLKAVSLPEEARLTALPRG